MRSRFVLALASTTAVLTAQGVVPPLVLQVVNPHPGLSTPAVPYSSVQQLHVIHLPTDPANVFSVSMTVTGLGVGSSDLLCGSYDVTTDTFTPNNDAAGLNTAGTEFGLMQHHTGLFAVYDLLPGPPHLASRTGIGQPWVDMGPIGPIPSQSYYDPAIADYQGQTYLIHVLGTEIAMTPIDVTNAQLTGPSRVLARAAAVGSTANSPTPVVDPNGELIGLSHHDVLGSDNDHYMSLDLDPNTPSVLMNDTTSWTNNGGFIGGRFFDAESAPGPYHALAIDTYWFTGGRGPVGGAIHIAYHVPPTTGSEIYFSSTLLALGFAPAGVALPGIQGLFGLDLASVFWDGNLLFHNNTNGSVSHTINVPNAPWLAGVTFAAQSVHTEALSNTFAFGNTARISVD